MRIIGTLLNEDQARRFCAYLKSLQIESSCEMNFDAATGHMSYPIWVVDEDQLQKASDALLLFQKSPFDAQFNAPLTAEPEEQEPIEPEKPLIQPRFSTRATSLILLLCAFIFFWNGMQEAQMKEEGFFEKEFFITPVQAQLFYDLPPEMEKIEKQIETMQPNPSEKAKTLSPQLAKQIADAERAPYWQGIYQWVLLKARGEDTASVEGPLFVKIREGQVWRFFSPAVLHTQFLHILFNMIWLWVLARPVEQRIGALRTLVLSGAIALFSNTAQYLVSGPLFIGYSGVVMGLAGFIWMREKIAPWEGYPLHRSTILFLVLFVLAMAALQIGSFFALIYTPIEFAPGIANTAHISGAFIGALLARFSFFEARIPK